MARRGSRNKKILFLKKSLLFIVLIAAFIFLFAAYIFIFRGLKIYSGKNIAGNTIDGTVYPVLNDNSLVLYMPFNNDGGGIASDLSGKGNNGNVNGAVWNSSGKYGGAYNFDGIDDFISVADSPSLSLLNFTISAWIINNKPGPDYGTILIKDDDNTQNRVNYFFQVLGSELECGFHVEGGGWRSITTSSASVPYNKWNHVACTYNGNELSIYLNGRLIETGNFNPAIPVRNNGNLKIGKEVWYKNNNFKGVIDEVKLWNISLSAEEVNEVYNSGQACLEKWECGSWSSCVNGMQTRSCTDLNSCGTTANKPAESQTCVSCAENWQCNDWSACANGMRGRECIDMNNCGTFVNTPVLQEACAEEKKCIENWECTGFGGCADGVERRVCADRNNCGTEINKPEATRSCEIAEVSEPAVPEEKISEEKVECRYTKVAWTDADGNVIKEAKGGDVVYLDVEAEGCDGKEVDFTTYETDGIFGKDEREKTADVIKNGKARKEIVVHWEPDPILFGLIATNPEFVFHAKTNPEGDSGVLSVSQGISGSGIGIFAITPSVVASRTSCVAPCAVFFDASGTTGLAENDYLNAYFSWNFGDNDNIVWNTTGKKKNRATGFNVAHVYEQAGTFSVNMHVKDKGGQEADATPVTITVSEPNVTYAGTNTRCTRSTATGDFSGCPSGAEQVTSSDLASQISWVQGGSNRRLLLRNGDSWTTPSTISISSNGPHTIGAFGSGSKPKITFSTGELDVDGTDWRLMDLEIVASSTSNSASMVFSASNLLGFRLNIHNSDWVGFQVAQDASSANYFLVDSYVHDNGYFSIYTDGKYIGIMGSTIDQARIATSFGYTTESHNIYIANNLIDASRDSPTTGIKWHARKGVINDNDFFAGAARLALANDGAGGAVDDDLGRVLIERNRFLPNVDSVYDFGRTMGIGLKDNNYIVIRNNLFNEMPIAIMSEVESRTTANVSIYNNAIYKNTPIGYNRDEGDFLNLGVVDNYYIYNNLVYVPSDTTTCGGANGCPYFIKIHPSDLSKLYMNNNLYYKPLAPFTFQVNEVDYTYNQWKSTFGKDTNSVNANPLLVNPNAVNFHLQSNSPAINAGANVPVWEDYDRNVRPIGAGWDIGAFENVSGGGTPPASAINISLNASRSSCVAPCAVFFDATRTTSTTTTRPFHELEYTWNFGDPSSGNWTLTTNKSRNSAKGAVAAHVFESPGSYTVSLNVKDNASHIDSKSVVINVQDANVNFSGTNTICFTTGSNFTGCPTGAAQVPSATWANIISSIAPGKRLLLRRGDTWNINSGETILPSTGPGIIGAYGSGNKPVINQNSVGGVFSFSAGVSDWRIMDLKLVGLGAGSAGSAIGNGGDTIHSQTLVLRLDISSFAAGYVVGGNNYHPHDYNFIVESTFTNIGSTSTSGADIYFCGRNSVIMGNIGAAVLNEAEHIVRIWHGVKMVISNNILEDPMSTKLSLKYHADATISSVQPSEYSIISDNTFKGDIYAISIAPQDQFNDEHLENIIAERNRFLSKSTSDTHIILSARNVTIRNNVFDSRGGIWMNGVHVIQTGPEPPPADNYIYNNIFYMDSGVQDFNPIWISSESSHTVVRNNLAIDLSPATKPLINNEAGSQTIESNNFLRTNANDVVNAAGGDFHLRTNSNLIDAGYAVPVWEDFDGVTRPQGIAWDIGAFENGTGGAAPPVSAINISLNASRSSCVAPCAVFFDATRTTSTTTNRPFHELEYTWNFGDPTSGVWATDGKSKNTAKGGVAVHVFESPGSYTINLTVKDGSGNINSKIVSAIITNPNVIFNGTNTTCFAKDNLNWTGCPSGASQVVSSDASIVNDINSRVASNRRLLLRRGDSWTISTGIAIDAAGPGTLGAFGSGGKPGLVTNVAGLPVITVSVNDWRIMDLYLMGPSYSGDSNGNYGIFLSSGNNDLVLRNNITKFTDCGISSGQKDSDNNALVENNVYDMGLYAGYPAGNRISIIGNVMERSAGTHILRVWQAKKAVIEHNRLLDPSYLNDAGRVCLKFVSEDGDFSELAVVSDNLCRASAWGISFAPEAAGYDERIMNIVFERNKMVAGTINPLRPTTNFIAVSARNVTIRNNVFDSTGSPWGPRAITIERTSTLVPPSADIFVYGNTFYTPSSAAGFYGLEISESSNVVIRNNLVDTRSTTAGGEDLVLFINHDGSQVTTSNNIFYSPNKPANCIDSSGGSSCTNPLLVNPAAGDLHLQANSPAINTGAAIISLVEDYDGNARPIGAGWDIGAFENGTGGGAEICGNSYCNASAGETCITCPGDCGSCPDLTPPTAPTLLNVTGVGMTRVNLSWNASTDDIGVVGYRIWRNNAIVGTTAGLIYSDNGLLPGTLYRYNVTAYDASGKNSTSSNQVSATTLSDTTPPNITSVTAVTNTSVVVVYNEMVNRTTAQATGNYKINNGITVSSAVLASDNVTLTLTTSMHSSGLTYTLNVTGMKDLAGNTAGLLQRTYQWSAANPISCGAACSGCSNHVLAQACSTGASCDGTNIVANINLSDSVISPGESLGVSIDYGCWAQNEDSLALWYFNGTGWRLIQSWVNVLTGCDGTTNDADGRVSTSFFPDSNSGTHYVRAIESGNGGSASSAYCPVLGWGDVDDLAFSVLGGPETCGNNYCAAGENCPRDNVSCADNTCYEPTCVNGCGQILVANGSNDEGCLAPSYCNGAGSCVSSSSGALRISPSGKYLEYNGTPFLIVGSAGWELTTELSQADAVTYLDNIKAKGFNAVEIRVIGSAFQSNAPNNYYNEPPFTNGENDWSVRNEAYWTHIDYVLTQIKNRGMIALVFPAYLGYGCSSEGWCLQMIAQSDAVMTNYGQWIGNRYKNYGNILWMTGGDFDDSGTAVESKNDAVANGINSVDPDAIFSVEPATEQIGGIDSYVTLVDINGIYTYGSPQSMAQTAYGNARPFIFQEGYYENEHGTNTITQDSQAMIAYLGGSAGHVFGSCPLWSFGVQSQYCDSNLAPFNTWQNNMNSPGSISQGRISKLMISRKWWTFVPDYANTVMTNAKGSELNYHATARELTGETVMVWAPNTNAITINMSKISGSQSNTWWYNVTDGSSVLIGTYSNSGTRSFTPPRSRLVLVIDDASKGLAAPGTSVYSGAGGCTDGDSDGYNLTAGGSCGATADCNDGNAAIHPGATELCNGVDDNCVNGIDEGCGFSVSVGKIVGASGNGDGKIALLAGTVKNVVFNFSANGSVGNLNDSSAKALFYKNGVNRMNFSCRLIYSAANKKTYGCTIGMWFYDEAGDWAINVNVSDNSGNVYGNNSEIASVEILREVILSSAIINFPGINPGNTNVLALYMPLNITNQGNYESNVSVLGHNLHGITNRSEYINVNNFRAGIDSNVCNSGSSLVNGTAVSVSGSWLPRGASSTEETYYCIKTVPAVSTQVYSTLQGYGWRIGFF